MAERAQASGGATRLDHRLEWALKWWRMFLALGRPRRVRLDRCDRPFLIFTDGACEEDGQLITAGALILEDATSSLKRGRRFAAVARVRYEGAR